jgi:hypothetical protein
MAIFAVVENGVVVNMIVADQAFADGIASSHQAVVQIAASDVTPLSPRMGWNYANSEFTEPI